MQEFLDMTFLGIAAARWFEAAAYVAGGFVVGLLASWTCKNVFGRIFAKTKTRVDDILLAAIRGPLVAIIVFLGIRMGIDSLPRALRAEERGQSRRPAPPDPAIFQMAVFT
jgi:MscS family membrane protein